MNTFKSSNPALSQRVFDRSRQYASSEVMTYKGTMNKTMLLLALVFLGAAYTWRVYFESLTPQSVYTWMLVGGIGGFITSLVVIFAPKTSPYTAPIYSALEGIFLGGLSAFFAASYGAGIVIQAVGLTFATFFLMLLAFRTGVIKVTNRFRRVVLAATGAIALTYLVSLILSFFNINIGFIYSGGTFGIVFSLIVIAVAALNILMDLDFIERSTAMGAPKFMEWYGAFGLMVTLVWLYIEFLRLLARVSRK
ncbi:MAG: Bax inhibitor-1/YccA family protein [Bacteroidales bacterium]|nr:Bax inhibitor-1/YccA family protein [Bacteroidales bacterium]HPD94978.1 Bax inhibitor-1/YccA family protein [Tenuifilaceae bacterium]HRX30479.1 Bax inhibitor-1/YccA family protein [Tenuifilaceae bacterium]